MLLKVIAFCVGVFLAVFIITVQPATASTITEQAQAHCQSAVDDFDTAMFCQTAAEEFALDADDTTGSLRDANLLEEAYCLGLAAGAFAAISQTDRARDDIAKAREVAAELISSGSHFTPQARKILVMLKKLEHLL